MPIVVVVRGCDVLRCSCNRHFVVFMPAAPLCVVCRSHHPQSLSCPCYRCGWRHSGVCWGDDGGILSNLSIDPALCVSCGYEHSSNVSCPCHRCGIRHSGDCASVCAQCNRCHSGKRCASMGNMTASRRSRARVANDVEISNIAPVIRHDLGDMCVSCPHCLAKTFVGEKISCCNGGLIVIPELNVVPSALSDIILSAHVRQNIRSYNSIMAFASTGHKNKSFVDGTFVLGGRAYHRMGSLLPPDGVQHCFSQIYILDTNDATSRRQQIMPTLRQNILTQLHDLMMQHNVLAQTFKTATVNSHALNLAHNAVGLTWSATDELSRFEVGALIEHSGPFVALFHAIAVL